MLRTVEYLGAVASSNLPTMCTRLSGLIASGRHCCSASSMTSFPAQPLNGLIAWPEKNMPAILKALSDIARDAIAAIAVSNPDVARIAKARINAIRRCRSVASSIAGLLWRTSRR